MPFLWMEPVHPVTLDALLTGLPLEKQRVILNRADNIIPFCGRFFIGDLTDSQVEVLTEPVLEPQDCRHRVSVGGNCLACGKKWP